MKRYSNSQNKAIIISALCFIVIAAMCIISRKSDAFYVNYYGEEFVPSEWTEYSIDENGIILSTHNNVKGNVINLENLTFSPGEYNLDFQYSTDTQGTMLYVRSLNTLNADNTTGAVYFEHEIDSQESYVTSNFTVEQYADDVEILIVLAENSNFSIGRFTITSQSVYASDSLVLLLLFALFFAFSIYLILSKKVFMQPLKLGGEIYGGKRTFILVLFIMVAVSLFIMYPMLNVNFFGGYDIRFHLNRIEGIKQALLSGQFPVRIHPDHLNQYGYANGIFYPELFLYFPAILRILGMSLKNAYFVFLFAINMLTLSVAYISFGKLFKSRYAGVFCAVLYTLAPYRLVNIYERSAVGEYVAMTFLPLVFYGLYSVIFADKKEWPYLVVGATGILQSHILSTAVVAVYCAIVCLIFIKRIFDKQKRYLELIKSAVAIIMINLWFIVPFFMMSAQLQISVFDRNPMLSANDVDFINEFFSINFLLKDRLNQEGIGQNGFGAAFLLAAVLLVCYIIMRYNKNKEHDNLLMIGLFSLGVVGVTIFITTPYFPWDSIQSISLISTALGSLQFVTRLLIIVSLLMVVVAGIVLVVYTKKGGNARPIMAAMVIILAVVSSWTYLDATAYDAPVTNIGTKSQTNLYADLHDCISLGEYVPGNSAVVDMLARGTAIEPLNEGIVISDVYRQGSVLEFSYYIDGYNESEQYAVIAPMTYYPSYKVTIDGVEYDSSAADQNYVKAELVKQSGNVVISYDAPLTFTLVLVISVVSSVIFLAFACMKKSLLEMPLFTKFKRHEI